MMAADKELADKLTQRVISNAPPRISVKDKSPFVSQSRLETLTLQSIGAGG